MPLDFFGDEIVDTPVTVPSPLCIYTHYAQCPHQGRAVIGPVTPGESPACVNQEITCTCGRTGQYSTNLAWKGHHDDSNGSGN